MKKILTTENIFVVLAILATIGLIATFVQATQAHAQITSEKNTIAPLQGGSIRDYTFFTATTTSATSTSVTATTTAYGMDYGYMLVGGAKKITMYFSRGEDAVGNAGASTFKVESSPDGTNWYSFNRLVTNDASGTATTTYSVTATSSVAVALNIQNFNLYAIRCIVVEVTDGAHTCKAQAEY